MSTATAVFIRFYDTVKTDQAKWQNFFVDKPVDGYVFRSFNSSDMQMNRTADEGGLAITMNATSDSLSFFEKAIEEAYLADIVLYEMDVTVGMPTDLRDAWIVGRFLGEVIGMGTNLTQLAVELGTAMDAVSGEIPGRRITTSLVGRLPTL